MLFIYIFGKSSHNFKSLATGLKKTMYGYIFFVARKIHNVRLGACGAVSILEYHAGTHSMLNNKVLFNVNQNTCI